MADRINLGVWGTARCESDAFIGVKNASEVAKQIAQAKWTTGDATPITRVEVMEALYGQAI